jgi:hypothetical protein
LAKSEAEIADHIDCLFAKADVSGSGPQQHERAASVDGSL